MAPEVHAEIRAAESAVQQAAAALDTFCTGESLPEAVAWPVRVAVDEVVANIAAYAVSHPAAADTAIELWIRRDADGVEVTVADDGPPFDPLAQPPPDTTLPLEAREPGGLGIMLVRSLMDDVRYARTTRNVLTMRKRMEPLMPTRQDQE